MMNVYVVNEINQFFFLTNCWWLNGLNYAVVDLFLKRVILKLKSKIGYFKCFCLRFNLNVFYLDVFGWLAVGITLEHTCCEAEEIENGEQQIGQWR